MSSLSNFYDEITAFGSEDVEKLCAMRQDFFDKTGKWIKMTSTAEVIEERGFDQSMEMINDINVLFEYLFREMIYWAEEEFGLNEGVTDSEGKFRLHDLASVPFLLHVESPDGNWSAEVVPGQETYTFSLPF